MRAQFIEYRDAIDAAWSFVCEAHDAITGDGLPGEVFRPVDEILRDVDVSIKRVVAFSVGLRAKGAIPTPAEDRELTWLLEQLLGNFVRLRHAERVRAGRPAPLLC